MGNMNPTQRQRVFDLIQQFGVANDSDNPAERIHWVYNNTTPRTAGIFEALFSDEQLSISYFRQLLADEFGLMPGQIDVSTAQETYSIHATVRVTLSFNGDDYLQFAIFGLTGAYQSTRQESATEARTYILANAGEWRLA